MVLASWREATVSAPRHADTSASGTYITWLRVSLGTGVCLALEDRESQKHLGANPQAKGVCVCVCGNTQGSFAPCDHSGDW
jgi:hypothetical protein